MDQVQMKAFKRDYHVLGKYHLSSQVPHLARLAGKYAQSFNKTRNWTDCLKSHALYNSCGVRRPDQAEWTERTYEIQKMFQGNCTKITYEEHKALLETLRVELTGIRNEIKTKMEANCQMAHQFPTECGDVADSLTRDFTETVMSVSQDCTEKMMKFAGKIMTHSVESMSEEPPCPFAVVAIGSMARGEATPYSDMEYMFLIEKRNSLTISYFKRLALASYFLIGNLRETKLSYMDIKELHGWFDDCAKNGFKIDGLSPGAGNIPTGRGTTDTENKFILTPEELLSQYNDVFQNPNPEESKRGDLTAMLAYMKSIYTCGEGAESLLSEFRAGVMRLNQSEERRKANSDMLLSDIKKFNFKPDSNISTKGMTVNVKKQIFRFPSILTLDLAILHGTNESSAWETLSALAEREIISYNMGAKLKFILSCACFIRLSAYLHHDSHDDRMSVAFEDTSSQSIIHQSLSNLTKDTPQMQQRWFVPFGLFFNMCHTMIPLKDQMKISTISDVLQSKTTLPLTWAEELKVFLYCDRVQDSMNILIQKFDHRIVQDATECIRILDGNREQMSDVAQVLRRSSHFYSAAQVYRLLCKTEPFSADEVVQFSRIHLELKEHEAGLQLLKPIQEKTADVYNSLGRILRVKGSLDEEEHCFLLSLDMYYKEASRDQLYDYYGEPIKIEDAQQECDLISMTPTERLENISHANAGVVRLLTALGNNYRSKGMVSESISHSLKALNLAQKFYGEGAVSHDVMAICNALNLIYNKNGQYDKGLEYSLLALRMTRQMYGEVHNQTSVALNNSGWSLMNAKHFPKAYIYIKQAISILKLLKQLTSVPVAHCLDSLGEYYHKTGQFAKSQQSYRDAKAIFEKHNIRRKFEIDVILSQLNGAQEHALQAPMKCCYPNVS